MKTSPTAFLFNATADDAPGYYGGPCNEALLSALEEADPSGETSSFILRGDLLLENLATKTTAVEKDANRSSWTQGYDIDLLATVYHDFVIDVGNFWNTFRPGVLLRVIGKSAIHCLVLPTLPEMFRETMDFVFRREVPFYLGAMEIDLGNPIQLTGFFHYLVKDAGVSHGSVILEADWEGDVHASFDGANSFRPNGLKVVPAGGLMNVFGPLPSADISPTGVAALRRFESKRRFTLQERVLDALRGMREEPGASKYRFTAKQDATMIFDAIIPAEKFAAFLLNPDHKDNKGRAKFFSEELGISPLDFLYLAAQIQSALDQADITQLKIKQWEGGNGVSFNLPITIAGRNGRSVLVDTNWIMRPGQQPSLSTVVPSSGHATEAGVVPAVLSPELKGDERWAALYALADVAGATAAEAFVPTPMIIVGFGSEAEGMCGSASVHVPDGRRDFARWLLRKRLAYRGSRGGATVYISSPTQSVDRAYAGAKAFARVLKFNGVDCSIARHLD